MDATLYQLLLLFLLFYLFLIRPEQKKAKKHAEMLNALKRGDKIMTRSGVYATVVKIENETDISVQIADNVTIVMSKAGVLNLCDEGKNVPAQSSTPAVSAKNKKTKK